MFFQSTLVECICYMLYMWDWCHSDKQIILKQSLNNDNSFLMFTKLNDILISSVLYAEHRNRFVYRQKCDKSKRWNSAHVVCCHVSMTRSLLIWFFCLWVLGEKKVCRCGQRILTRPFLSWGSRNLFQGEFSRYSLWIDNQLNLSNNDLKKGISIMKIEVIGNSVSLNNRFGFLARTQNKAPLN